MTLHRLLPIAHQAVDTARDYLRVHSPEVLTSKGDRDMASDVDYAIERRVRAILAEATPAIGFLGEEEGRSGTSGGLMWALDPVDGTVNLIHDHPLVSISLALVDDGRPVLGVIDTPRLGHRYWAVDGTGAFRNGASIQVSTTHQLADALIALGDYAVGPGADHLNSVRIAVTRGLAARVQRIRMHGSAAIDLAWLAAGVLDGVVILANNPWDVGAGAVIAREAGAAVVDINGAPHDQRAAATIGVTPAIADELCALIRSHLV